MKIGIFSDLHVHKHAMFCGPDGKQRLRDGLKVLRYIIELFRKEKCNAVIFLGDLFHIRRLMDVEVFNDTMDVLRKLHIKVLFAISGNHDWYGPNCESSSIEFLGEFGATVINRYEVYNTFDDVEMHFIPWLPQQKLADVLEHIGSKKTKGTRKLLFLHATPMGSSSATGHVFRGGIDLGAHADKFDVIFCGDIHKRQLLQPNIYIVGAPMHHNFGDEGQDRGVYVYDTTKGKLKFHSLRGVYPEFILTGDPDSIDDYNYYRLVISDHVKPPDRDNVKVMTYPSKVLKRRLNVNTATSPERVIELYADKLGDGLDKDMLIKMGKRILADSAT